MSSVTWIALVDDDLSVRRALPRLLRSAGYETRVFASAQELLESKFAHAAACLVLDIHLDRTNAFELLDQLRADGVTAPAILITAYDDNATRERARAAGAAAFLRKPFDASVLLDAIAATLTVGSNAPPKIYRKDF